MAAAVAVAVHRAAAGSTDAEEASAFAVAAEAVEAAVATG